MNLFQVFYIVGNSVPDCEARLVTQLETLHLFKDHSKWLA